MQLPVENDLIVPARAVPIFMFGSPGSEWPEQMAKALN